MMLTTPVVTTPVITTLVVRLVIPCILERPSRAPFELFHRPVYAYCGRDSHSTF